jgi:hypothetical protein
MKTLDSIDELIALDEKSNAIKSKQREVAKDYLRKVVRIFAFSPAEIFEEEKEHFRDGSLDKLRALFSENVNITRKDFIAKAVALGLNERTASTQHHRIRVATTFVPDNAIEFGYRQGEFVPVISKQKIDNNIEDDLCEVVLFECKLTEENKRYCVTYHALSQYLTEPIHFCDDLEEAKAHYSKAVRETKENLAIRAKNAAKKKSK